MYFDEFEADDLVFFSGNTGVSINQSQNRLVLFWVINKVWSSEIFSLDLFRKATEKVAVPSEFYSTETRGGVNGVGVGIGLAIRNSMEKSKAKNATGIELSLRSTDVPSFFLNVTDETTRASAMEAFRQILEDGKLVKPYRNISDAARMGMRRPTDEEIRRNEELNSPAYKKARRKRQRLAAVFLAIPLILGGAFWAIQTDRQGALDGALRYYISSLESAPESLQLKEGRLCDKWHTGYAELLKREGSDVTHVTTEMITMPVINGSRPLHLSRGLAVIVSQSDGTLEVTRNSQKYVNAPRSDFGQALPLPDDMSVFQAVVEPTCS